MQGNKLWQKGENLQINDIVKEIESFTVGNDLEFDRKLAKHDLFGTKAHITMLEKIGILSGEELNLLVQEIEVLEALEMDGGLEVEEGVEDIHSQIELHLSRKLGVIGEKIHTGRSRNDQVLLCIKLFIHEEIIAITQLMESLFMELMNNAREHKNKLMPGYTHFQIGMPSSFGLYFSCFAESLSDDLALLASVKDIVIKNPLGSGAGYGSSFPLDRAFTTGLLGMEKMHINSMYAQMTRVKTEKTFAFALSSIASTMGKLANDLCLFSNQNFGFVSFPDQLTTGSSIMPHKKNPDVLELVRGKCSRIVNLPSELSMLHHNLLSGYNRDYQLSKEILFPQVKELKSSLRMLEIMLANMKVQDDILENKKYDYLFSVEKIDQLVQSGVSFRTAYKKVGNDIENGTYSLGQRDVHHSHIGSIGNLCLEDIEMEFELQKVRIIHEAT